MKLLRRPLALSCICFVLCAVGGYFLSDFGFALAVVSGTLSCVLLSLYLILKKRAGKVVFTFLLCTLFSFFAFISSYLYFGVKLSEVEVYYGSEVELEGYVTKEVYQRSYGGCYYIKAEKIDGKSISAELILETEGAVLSEDDMFSMKVTLEPFEEDICGYAERAVSMSEGYLCSCVQSGEDYSIYGERKGDIVSYIYGARDWTATRFESLLDTRTAGLFTAAFAGDDTYVSDEDMLALRRSGTTHILAVSGTHFTVIMAAVLLFLKPLGLPIVLRNILLCTVAVIYTAFTGFSPSVVRSAVMLLITYLGGTLGRARDMTTSLFLTMMLMMACSPYLVLNAAFWLSSVATLGIILCLPPLEELFGFEHKSKLSNILRDNEIPLCRRILNYVSAVVARAVKGIPIYLFTSFTVSLFAMALALPVSLVFFKNMSLVAMISGFIMSPVASAIIVCAPFVLLLGNVSIVSFACTAAGEFFYAAAHFFSDIDGVYINIDYVAVKVVIVLFFASALAVVLCSKTQKPLIAVCAIFVLSSTVSAYISEAVVYNGVDAVYSSASDADALCVRGDTGIVISDMGSVTRSDIKSALAATASLRENTVSAYVISDMKQKHVSLVRYLCSNYRIDTLYMPQYVTKSKQIITDAASHEAKKLGVDVEYFYFGESFTVDGVELCVSELEYISRSTIALYSVSAKRHGRELLWVSRSYFEREYTDFVYGKSPELFVFGTYGAKVRDENNASISLLGAGKYVVPSEELLYSFSEESLAQMNECGLDFSDKVYFRCKKSE